MPSAEIRSKNRPLFAPSPAPFAPSASKGIGKNLIEEFEKWAKNKEVKYIELKVCNSNKCAVSLYSKKGYENIKSIMIKTLEK